MHSLPSECFLTPRATLCHLPKPAGSISRLLLRPCPLLLLHCRHPDCADSVQRLGLRTLRAAHRGAIHGPDQRAAAAGGLSNAELILAGMMTEGRVEWKGRLTDTY